MRASIGSGRVCVAAGGEQDKGEDKDAPRQLLPDIVAIGLSGRPVLIVFDTDSVRNPAATSSRRLTC